MNILQRLFKRRSGPSQAVVQVENTFQSFTGTPYGSAVYRSAVDAIARHVGKLQAHANNKHLEQLLTIRPNPYMGPYDLLYKLASAYYVYGNAFWLLDREPSGRIQSVFPLTPTSCEFLPGTDGLLYLHCGFKDGNEVSFPYSDVIHLRRHFLEDDLLGAGPRPIYNTLDTADTLNQGVRNAAKNGTGIRGILKFESIVNAEKALQAKEAFVRDYLSFDNAGGVAVTDLDFSFIPADMKPYSIPREQLDSIEEQVYSYLGVNKAIVDGNFTEDQFSSFYESVIEPFALALSQEVTAKTGVNVEFSADRMEFSSSQTKISLIREAAPLSMMTINEARRILFLPPLPDGDERLQSLNYVSAAHADEYQLGTKESDQDEKNEEEETNGEEK